MASATLRTRPWSRWTPTIRCFCCSSWDQLLQCVSPKLFWHCVSCHVTTWFKNWEAGQRKRDLQRVLQCVAKQSHRCRHGTNSTLYSRTASFVDWMCCFCGNKGHILGTSLKKALKGRQIVVKPRLQVHISSSRKLPMLVVTRTDSTWPSLCQRKLTTEATGFSMSNCSKPCFASKSPTW